MTGNGSVQRRGSATGDASRRLYSPMLVRPIVRGFARGALVRETRPVCVSLLKRWINVEPAGTLRRVIPLDNARVRLEFDAKLEVLGRN